MIEEEVKARVDFKMNELITSLKNRIKIENRCYFQDNQAFATSVKHLHYQEAFKQLLGMVEKERDMGTPSDNMYKEKTIEEENVRREIRDKAVDKINYAIKVRTKGAYSSADRHYLTKTIVSVIEDIQNNLL